MATAPLPSATHRVAKQRQPRYLHLTECSFHGTYVTESDLLDFLKAVQPATVTLSNIRVITRTYAAIFNHLTGPDSPVIAYNLGRRHPRGKRSSLVHFEVPGSSKFPYKRGEAGPSFLSQYVGHASRKRSAIACHLEGL